MSNEPEESKKKWETAGLCVPGFLFLGLGIGWALGYMIPGLFIGLGAGLLALAVVRMKMSK
ncbi:MAG: hypothetical protein JW846_06150 [Dehalococcoidia bacterium]|nr:hypothetical protein [Dehalococcoidia bacterium]